MFLNKREQFRVNLNGTRRPLDCPSDFQKSNSVPLASQRWSWAPPLLWCVPGGRGIVWFSWPSLRRWWFTHSCMYHQQVYIIRPYYLLYLFDFLIFVWGGISSIILVYFVFLLFISLTSFFVYFYSDNPKRYVDQWDGKGDYHGETATRVIWERNIRESTAIYIINTSLMCALTYGIDPCLLGHCLCQHGWHAQEIPNATPRDEIFY
jgi:hypothetical protein